MSGTERPEELREALLIARKVTDPRSEYEVYRDIARVLVRRELKGWLKDVPLPDSLKTQVIESRAMGIAQPAHLNDAANGMPIHLLGMLEDLGVIRPERPNK